jgi:hypothetical protein
MKAIVGHKTETTSYHSDWSAGGSSLSHRSITDNVAARATRVGGQDEKKTSLEPPREKEGIGPISQIIEKFNALQSSKNSSLTHRQRGVLELISKCGHHELGHVLSLCAGCQTTEFLGWSRCNSRNCPNCGAKKRAEWYNAVQERLPKGRYFHLVFSIPHEFNSLLFSEQNRAIIFDALMKASAETIRSFAATKFNANPFILSVLHTWTQNLALHPHTHSLVSADMYDEVERKWRHAQSFLFPVRDLVYVFRGKFLNSLRESVEEKEENHRLILKPGESESCIVDWLDFAEKLPKRWAAYISKPMKSHANVVKYFATYVNRSAITNSRIASFDDVEVKIIPKRRSSLEPPDPKGTTKERKNELIVLPIDEFIRRFAQHFPPKGFRRIRYYGLASPSSKTGRELKAKRLQKVDNKPLPTKVQATCKLCSTGNLWLIIVRVNPYSQQKIFVTKPIWRNSE